MQVQSSCPSLTHRPVPAARPRKCQRATVLFATVSKKTRLIRDVSVLVAARIQDANYFGASGVVSLGAGVWRLVFGGSSVTP
jgi:hypothetical protein